MQQPPSLSHVHTLIDGNKVLFSHKFTDWLLSIISKPHIAISDYSNESTILLLDNRNSRNTVALHEVKRV